MFLRDLAYGLLRRWYVVVVGLLATAGLGYYIYQVVPVTYNTTASLVLIPPETAVLEGDNPYLYMGGLEQALSVLLIKVGSSDMNNAVLGEQSSSTYEIYKDQTTTGPIMVVEAVGDTPQESVRVLRSVIAEVPGSLKTMQDELKVPAPSMISVSTIAVDSKATPMEKDRVRLVLVAVAGAGTLTLLTTALLDHLLVQRRRRRSLAAINRGSLKRRRTKSPTGESDGSVARQGEVFSDGAPNPETFAGAISGSQTGDLDPATEHHDPEYHHPATEATQHDESEPESHTSSMNYRG
ncbi:hypothetical protein [Arthrobacter rhombi]|uniref:hypothetical protein n=1 Tax=Arthrobacter rhombi TaxID=71253 RepID=UPI003FD5BBB4